MDRYAIVTEKIINLLEQGIVPLASAVDRNRTAVQSRIEKAVPGRELVAALGDQIHLALMAHHEASERAWRIGA